jgi:hypothetical protein
LGDEHAAQLGQIGAHGTDALPLLLALQHQHRSLAVRQDVGNAAGVVDGVQRHWHMAAGQRGLVDAHGVQPIGLQDGNARAWGQCHGGQRLAPLLHALRGLGPAQGLPTLK